MDSSGSLWTQVIIILILTAINAFFASAEIAFVSVNQSKMKQWAEDGDKRAQRVLDLLEDSDDFLATIQVAITLAGFLSSASAATSFAGVISEWLPNFPGAETAALVIVTLILSYITLVLGELFPKQVALQMPEKVAMATSGVIHAVQVVFKPFIVLLSASTGLLQKITPIEFTAGEEKFTRDEMKAILTQGRAQGSIDLEEFSMLQGVLSLDHKMAREVMVPRTDTEMIDIEDSYEENIEEILSSPFSRIPIYQEDKDNVIAVLHVKNLLRQSKHQGYDNLDLLGLSSEPLFVPSTVYIDDLLVEFRRKQTHMAILRDEYGGVEGIVTLEDVLEEIVGEIEDESDVNPSAEIQKISDDFYSVNGLTTIEKFNNYFDKDLESREVETMAGLIIHHLGYVPEDNERVSSRCEDLVLTTSVVENGRIRDIEVVVDPDETIETHYDLCLDMESANLTEEFEALEELEEDDD
ncbi:hemolysin family protein [Hutsoniella sourekii]|uniref:hemolysin family protein n=1 Tax=Hutsoniella sourekii TaxID=87650 RepID=UPI0004836E83|nr:hemolysin family protein [Hutsoniella sourekii]